MKHGIGVVELPVNGQPPPNSGVATEAASQAVPWLKASFQNSLFAQLQHLRQSFDSLDWVLFDKDKILDLLNLYRKYTERLHEVVTLILPATRKSGFFENWDMPTNPIGANPGLMQVAEHQNRSDSNPYTSFAPLGGDIRGESSSRPFRDYQVVEYDEGLKSGRIQAILEEHKFNIQKGVYSGHSISERRNEELQPIRTLA